MLVNRYSYKWAVLSLSLIFGGVGCCYGPCGPCGSGGVLPGQLLGRVGSRIVNPCPQGCGEVYYDERINNPPVCDPCGGAGVYTGQSCGECRPLLDRLRTAWGLPYVGPCECSAGCDMTVDGVVEGHSPTCSSCQAHTGEYAPHHHTVPHEPVPMPSAPVPHSPVVPHSPAVPLPASPAPAAEEIHPKVHSAARSRPAARGVPTRAVR